MNTQKEITVAVRIPATDQTVYEGDDKKEAEQKARHWLRKGYTAQVIHFT